MIPYEVIDFIRGEVDWCRLDIACNKKLVELCANIHLWRMEYELSVSQSTYVRGKLPVEDEPLKCNGCECPRTPKTSTTGYDNA